LVRECLGLANLVSTVLERIYPAERRSRLFQVRKPTLPPSPPPLPSPITVFCPPFCFRVFPHNSAHVVSPAFFNCRLWPRSHISSPLWHSNPLRKEGSLVQTCLLKNHEYLYLPESFLCCSCCHNKNSSSQPPLFFPSKISYFPLPLMPGAGPSLPLCLV